MSGDGTRKAPREFRLPDRTVTRSIDTYLAEWGALGDFLERMFPGYRVFGYDPGVIMHHPDGRGSFDVTAHAALALRGAVDAIVASAAPDPTRQERKQKRRKRGSRSK